MLPVLVGENGAVRSRDLGDENVVCGGRWRDSTASNTAVVTIQMPCLCPCTLFFPPPRDRRPFRA